MKALRKRYASLMGYFWLPCPICGREFGGFEIADESLNTSYSTGKCVCRKCGKKAKELNKKSHFTMEKINGSIKSPCT